MLVLHSDNERLEAYQQAVTQTTSEVYSTLSNLFSEINKAQHSICSDAELKLMRQYLWTHSELTDIARLQDKQIICSASWGKLASPIPLPVPTKSWQKSGFYHWRNTKDALQGTLDVNMIANNKILMLVAPNAYSSISPEELGTGFIISTNDGYIPNAFGPIDPEDIIKNSQSSFNRLVHQKCGTTGSGVCITVYNSKPGLLGKDHTFLLVICLISLVLSVLIYITLISLNNHRNSMRKALKRALRRKEIYVVFQPKVQLKTGRVVGMEALARWHHHKFGQVPPDVFVNFAEENGLMPTLTRVVIEKAIGLAGDLLRQSSHLSLNLNLSMADLSDPMLLNFIDFQRQNHEFNAEQLIFEITETSASGFEQIEQSVDRFVSRGYRISLDDFGTGYANLSWLSKIKASEIKVDRSFTHMIGSPHSTHSNTLDAIFTLLDDLKVSTVFEGIETQQQADYVLNHCRDALGQGWHYAKPMSIEQLQQFISQGYVSLDNIRPASSVTIRPMV
nr:EAL domain-containing protein [Neptunicella marina]